VFVAFKKVHRTTFSSAQKYCNARANRAMKNKSKANQAFIFFSGN